MLDVNDRIRTASQQIDIDRSHPEKGTHADHKVNGSLGAPTVPPDPTAPTLVSATATTLTIEWTHPGDGGSPLTRNFIEYRVEGTTDWTNWYRGETPTPVTRTVITNLAAATAYDVRVHSTNAIGNSSVGPVGDGIQHAGRHRGDGRAHDYRHGGGRAAAGR